MTEHVIGVVPGLVRRHKADGRSVYDKAAKAELVRRCQRTGVSVAKMALAHGVNANLLRKWMTLAPASQAPHAVSLVPVRTGRADLPSAPDAGYLELIVPGGMIRVHGQVATATL